MRSKLFRAASVVIALAAPIATASTAFAYAGDDYDYARDSYPLIQTWQQTPSQQNFAAGPAQTRSDATPGAALRIAPPSGGAQSTCVDQSGVTHFGSFHRGYGSTSTTCW